MSASQAQHLDLFGFRLRFFKNLGFGSVFVFYRAMHYNAKRGRAIACPSVSLPVSAVCPSATLADCDHTGWKPRKLTGRTISRTPSLFVAQRPSTYSLENMEKFWGRLEVTGVGKKVACWSTKAAISPKRVKIEEQLQRVYRNSPTLFLTVPSPTHTASSSPRLGVHNPTQNCNLKFWTNEW